jgi:hypothetical protein
MVNVGVFGLGLGELFELLQEVAAMTSEALAAARNETPT